MPVKKGRISIQERDFSVDSELDGILSGKAGGTVIFVGSVRGGSPKGRVPYLDFESYWPMAREKLDQIKAAAMKGFGVEAITVIHRTGRIRSGGRIVLIAVSAAHRDAAFRACRYVLEELKKHVPIWKNERGEWTCGEGPVVPALPTVPRRRRGRR